jgi:hypothetical protein
MAQSHRVPATRRCVGFEYSLPVLRRIVPTRRLKFLFESIDIWGIDRPVPQYDISSGDKRMLEPLDNGIGDAFDRHRDRVGRAYELLRARARTSTASGSRDAAITMKPHCHGNPRRAGTAVGFVLGQHRAR